MSRSHCKWAVAGSGTAVRSWPEMSTTRPLCWPHPAPAVSSCRRPRCRPPGSAFLFPGQGAQFVGMGADLYRTESTYRHLVDECLGLLPDRQRAALRTHLLGRRDPASEALADTALAQPALFIVEYALARTLESWGLRADMLLGHSIGEYIAATLAGVFSLADALRVVVARGELVSALPHGAMLSLPVPEETARTLAAGHDVCVAAVNAEALVAVAGGAEAMDKFEPELAKHRIAGRRLRVSHAFHSAMMDPVLAEFEAHHAIHGLAPAVSSGHLQCDRRQHDEQTATDPSLLGGPPASNGAVRRRRGHSNRRAGHRPRRGGSR